ncbi:MAG TPA: zinc ribbon domain-containing protein [Clostridiales bacterium]|nr:zinc ribbon domain-containing protein [Clostridiales bacterium]
MAFFDNLGKKVGEAAQAAAKKSGELVEVTKLNMSISTEEDKIKKLYSKIGENTYAKFRSASEIDPDFIADCEEIESHEEAIKNIRAKIMEIKNVKACMGCGAELDRNAMFCPKCGAKQEPVQAAETQSATSVFCQKCGAAVTDGSAFCQSCGAKIE